MPAKRQPAKINLLSNEHARYHLGDNKEKLFVMVLKREIVNGVNQLTTRARSYGINESKLER